MDAVEIYRHASEENDLATLMAALAPDAELVSPLSGHMIFRGHDDLRVLLGVVYGSLTDLRWQEEVGDRLVRVVAGECRVLGLRLGDAMVLELSNDGKIVRIRPHLRPWLATSAFAGLIGQAAPPPWGSTTRPQQQLKTGRRSRPRSPGRVA